MIGHIGPISGIAAHSARYVATAGYDNKVILWDALTRTALECGMHDHLANQCSFSQCGNYLVTASSDYTARIWDVPTLRLRSVLRGHRDDVEMAVFDSTSSRVATCSRDNTVKIFSLNGETICHMSGHDRDVISVAWAKNDKFIITSSDDGTIRRWDSSNGTLQEIIDLEGIETDTIVIRSDGLVIAGNDSGELVVIDNGQISRIKAHAAGIKRLIMEAGETRIASLSYDRKIIIWQLGNNGKLSQEVETTLPDIVWPRSAAFLSTSVMAFGTFGSCYALLDLTHNQWDVSTIEPDRSVNAVTWQDGHLFYVGDSGEVFKDGKSLFQTGSLCNFFVPIGKSLLTGGQSGAVWDVHKSKEIHRHQSPINCGTAFQKDNALWAILGTYTGQGILLKYSDTTIEHMGDIPLHKNAIKGIAVTGNHIFSVCASGAVAWHDIRTFQPKHVLENAHTRISNGCAPLNGNGFASIGRDLKLRIWDNKYDQACLETPHKNSIKCIAIDDSGRYIATGSYTGFIALYDNLEKSWIKTVRPTTSGISSLCALPNNKFAASSYDGKLYKIEI